MAKQLAEIRNAGDLTAEEEARILGEDNNEESSKNVVASDTDSSVVVEKVPDPPTEKISRKKVSRSSKILRSRKIPGDKVPPRKKSVRKKVQKSVELDMSNKRDPRHPEYNPFADEIVDLSDEEPVRDIRYVVKPVRTSVRRGSASVSTSEDEGAGSEEARKRRLERIQRAREIKEKEELELQKIRNEKKRAEEALERIQAQQRLAEAQLRLNPGVNGNRGESNQISHNNKSPNTADRTLNDIPRRTDTPTSEIERNARSLSTESRRESTRRNEERTSSRSRSGSASSSGSRYKSRSRTRSSSRSRSRSSYRGERSRRDSRSPRRSTGVTDETLKELLVSMRALVDRVAPATNNSSSTSNPEDEVVYRSTAEARMWKEKDAAYKTLSFFLRSMTDKERLQGRANFADWRKMIDQDLDGLQLHPLIESLNGEGIIDVSESKRRMLSAQSMQYIKHSVSKHVLPTLRNATSAFEAVGILTRLYKYSTIHERLQLETRFKNYRFKLNWHKEEFVARYERFIEDFEKLGDVFTEQAKVVKFLERLDGLMDKDSPFYSFYRDITSMKAEEVTYDLVIQRFHSVAIEKGKRKADEKNAGSSDAPPAKKSKEGSSFHKKDENKSDGKSSQSKKHAPAIPIAQKYTQEQRDRLKSMSNEEKEKIRCKKCSDYFHDASTCKNPGKCCRKCHAYGHIKRDCKHLTEEEKKKYSTPKPKS